MNITAVEKRAYSKLKLLQISEDELTAENFGTAAYNAGMLYMANFLMRLRGGELTQKEADLELAKLEPMEAVN